MKYAKYNPLTVAEYIVKYCNENEIIINNHKLQCVLYYTQAEFMVVKGIPCFAGYIFVQSFGISVPEVYKRYSGFANSHIPFTKSHHGCEVISEEDQHLIAGVIEECKYYYSSTLLDIIKQQTPYRKAVNGIISEEELREYFKTSDDVDDYTVDELYMRWYQASSYEDKAWASLDLVDALIKENRRKDIIIKSLSGG